MATRTALALFAAVVATGCANDDDPIDPSTDPPAEICDNDVDDDGDDLVDCADPGCTTDSACSEGEAGPWDMSLTTYHSFRGVKYEANAPIVAFADGDGDFAPLAGTGGLYDFRVTDAAGRYTVVVACEGRAGVRVHHALATEGTDLHIEGCLSVDTTTFPELTFLGTVVGHDCMGASVGYAGLLHTCGADQWFAPAVRGPQDIIATTSSPTHREVPDRLYVEHGIELQTNQQSHTIDFGGARSAAPAVRSVDPGANGFAQAVVFFTRYTSRNMSPLATMYAGVPVELQRAEDIHRWCSGSCVYFKEPRDLVADAPAPITVTVAGDTPTIDPYPRHRVDWSVAAVDPITGYRIQVLGDANRMWTIQLSAGFLGGVTSYQLPDLSALAGFGEPLHPIASATVSVRAYAGDAFVIAMNAEWLPVLAPEGFRYQTGSASISAAP